MAETVKVKKSVADLIRWLNSEGGLVSELRLAAVAKPLSTLDESVALEILHGLMSQEEPVDDPTLFVKAAAQAMSEEVPDEADPEDPDAPPVPPPPPKAPAAGKVKLPASTVTAVRKLSASGRLKAPLPLPDVAQGLSLISKEAQEEVLAALQQRAADVHDPVAWVNNACNRKAGKGKGKGKGAKSKKGKEAAKPLTASEQKILRTINFINGTFQLGVPISYRYVKESLDLVDEKTQLKVLQKMKDKLEEGTEFANPTTWIKKACWTAKENWDARMKEKQAEKRKAAAAEEWGGEEWAEEEWAEEAPAPKKKKVALAATKTAEWEGEENWEEWDGV